MFSSRSFIVSGLTFRSLINFEFIFCMVLESVLVSFFYKWLTSFPTPLVKEIVFFPLYILASFVKDKRVHRCVDLSLGFLFCSIDLYFCLCASTILS